MAMKIAHGLRHPILPFEVVVFMSNSPLSRFTGDYEREPAVVGPLQSGL
jgi:hypothetical protein